MNQSITDGAIIEITDAICEIAEGNECIDFEEFLDVLQQINIDPDDDNNLNKSLLTKYFSNLLLKLQCDSAELNIDKFNKYILSNYNQYKQHTNQYHQQMNSIDYMKYLIQNDMNHLKSNTNNTNNINNHHHQQHIGNVNPSSLISIATEINEYLDDSQSMDYQDFIGCCREFVGDSYPERNLKIVYQFISKQQCLNLNIKYNDNNDQDIEINVAFFLKIISKYGDPMDDMNDIVKSVFDKISHNVLKNRQSELIENLKFHLKKEDKKSCGMVTLEEFISGLKSANVNSISSRDMKKIFNLSTTNGRMKINLFIERFSGNNIYDDTNPADLAYDIDELILNAFDGIVKKRDKKKKKKKHKKKRKKRQRERIQILSAKRMQDDESKHADIDDDKNGFEKLQIAFKTIDEDNDNIINFEEFMAVIVGDLKMELKQTECKQIYFHQQLTKEYRLDLNEFFDQIHEEFLSFPEGTSYELLRRYFAKILQEAAPFEKLNQFILDYILPTTSNNLQNEIINTYGSMSTNPLLRRVYKKQIFDYTNKYKDLLSEKVTPKMLGEVIRKIRTDSSLKDKEIDKMYDEWLICLNRIHSHKFNDLYELDFLLFHLGLIVSNSLLRRFTNTYLNTVFESEEVRNSMIDKEQNSMNDVLQHLIPSFMKTSKETTNLELLKSDLLKKNKLKNSRQRSNGISLTEMPLKDIHEALTYEDTKIEYANKLKLKFKLVDLVGEFIDDQDNTINIAEEEAVLDDDDEDEVIKQSKTDNDLHSMTTKKHHHHPAKLSKHKRSRSELLLSKAREKTIYQRRKERIETETQQKQKKRNNKRRAQSIMDQPQFVKKAASVNFGEKATSTSLEFARNKLLQTISTKNLIGDSSPNTIRKSSLSKPLAAPLLGFKPNVNAAKLSDLDVGGLLSLNKARSVNDAEESPNFLNLGSKIEPLHETKTADDIHEKPEEELVFEEMIGSLRSRVGSIDATADINGGGRVRTNSIGVIPSSGPDIDLVSNSDNRYLARMASTFLEETQISVDDDDDDDDDEDHDGSNSSESIIINNVAESMTYMTPQSEELTFSFPEEDGDKSITIKSVQLNIDEKLNEDEEDEEDEDGKYNIIGQEKVDFDPYTSEAIYDPVTNVLTWSNGTKWIKKDFQVFKGKWRDPHGDVVLIDEKGVINYIKPKLGQFPSRIIGFFKIATHVQSNTYHAQLIDNNNLKWDNGTIWKRVGEQMLNFLE